MNDHYLELILQYKMSKEEALAFKIAILYLDTAREYFPEYKHNGFPKKGDPRKCDLFRYCWKLVDTTKDKLKPEDYKFYIQAQMSILKNIKAGPAKHLFYGHRCLIGEPAWNRWMVWKKYFEAQKSENIVVNTENNEIDVKNILSELKSTQIQLKKRLDTFDVAGLTQMLKDGTLFRLIPSGIISKYFFSLSEVVLKYCKENAIDLKKYDIVPLLNKNIIEEFKKLFPEF